MSNAGLLSFLPS